MIRNCGIVAGGSVAWRSIARHRRGGTLKARGGMLGDYYSLSNDEISVWLEQGQSLCIKAIAKGGDPVELTSGEARMLSEIILKLADKADRG